MTAKRYALISEYELISDMHLITHEYGIMAIIDVPNV